MNSNLIASMTSVSPRGATLAVPDDVIEIGLLLPTKRAADLFRLAKDRQVSVGQLLRKLIDQELASPF